MAQKALFFDLDHSLIRPKSGEGCFTILDDEPQVLPPSKVAINHEAIGNGYVRVTYKNMFPVDGDDWEFVPGVVDAIRPFIVDGFMFVIISNQGGIEAGHHTEAEIEYKLMNVLARLAQTLELMPSDGYRYAFRYCGSLQDHPDRKPRPGMVLTAIEEYDLDPQASYSVGDMNSDYQAFSAAGIRHYFHIDHFIESKPTPEIHLFQ